MFARRITSVLGALCALGFAAGGTTAVANTPTYAASHRAERVHLDLSASNNALATCFPYARGSVSVKLLTDKLGFDIVTIRTSGLQPNTDFTAFLLEKPGAPFGAAEYFGDFTTDRHGRGYAQFRLIAEEAFAFNNATGTRTDLNSVGFWFADPKADDACLGAASPVTGFDGDGSAGVQMMNTGANVLP